MLEAISSVDWVMPHFTAEDVIGIVTASLLLLPFLFAPGYALGWVTDLFGIRRRGLLLQATLAVPLSIAICPILAYLLARYSRPGLWLFFGGVSLASLAILITEARRSKWRPKSNHFKIAAGILAIWALIAIVSLVDLQIGHKLYLPTAAYDHSIRTAMTAELAHGLPAHNPFFANSGAMLRYHYLWMLACSLPLRLMPIAPRYALYAGVIWCGIGLMALIALAIKFFLHETTEAVPKALLGACLLAVTGLDILPTALQFALYRQVPADMEWWNPVQITSWASSLLWVPHNIASLIACFLGVMLLRKAADDGKHRVLAVLVAGAAFASSVGLAIYVSFTFVIAIGFWLLSLVARKAWTEAGMFAGAGAFAGLLAVPYLAELSSRGTGGPFVELGLRQFPLGLDLLHVAGLSLHSAAAVLAANVLMLPLDYLLELGFFAAIAVIRLRQLRRGVIPVTNNELAGWTLVGTSFLVGSFLRSNTIASNDLGFRCFLPAQLILLLWAASMLYDWRHQSPAGAGSIPGTWLRRTAIVMLVLGIFGTAYELVMARTFPLICEHNHWTDLGWLDQDRHYGTRAYYVRDLYEHLDPKLPADAVIQMNPDVDDYVPHYLYSGHSAAAGSRSCGTEFGGDAASCAPRADTLRDVFESPIAMLDSVELDAMCREFGINVLVAQDTDGAWQDRSSWIWNRQPMLANSQVRAIACGDGIARAAR